MSRWQDVINCDRCGGAAQFKAEKEKEKGIDGEVRKLLLCEDDADNHAEALKAQKWTLTRL